MKANAFQTKLLKSFVLAWQDNYKATLSKQLINDMHPGTGNTQASLLLFTSSIHGFANAIFHSAIHNDLIAPAHLIFLAIYR